MISASEAAEYSEKNTPLTKELEYVERNIRIECSNGRRKCLYFIEGNVERDQLIDSLTFNMYQVSKLKNEKGVEIKW